MYPLSPDGPSRHVSSAGPLSRQEWVAESAAARLRIISEAVPTLCEPYGPLVLFLEGSALHGELCGLRDPSGAEYFLSDLDLGILTVRRVPPESMKEVRNRIDTEVSGRMGNGPAPKIGFYCSDDLVTQDPTLGFVEAVRRPLVLWGNPASLARFRVPAYDRIPPWEGKRLLSNRAVEWLGARARGRVPGLYAAAKVMADGAAVALLARGAYRGGGYAERLEEALALKALPRTEEARARAWTGWRIAPRWDSTPLGVGLNDLEASRVDKEVSASILGSMRFAAATEDPEAYLGSRAVKGRSWARAWRRWLSRAPGSLARLRTAPLTRTPRVLLFEAAICCATGREERASRIVRNLLGGGTEEAEGGAALGEQIRAIGETMSREGID